MDHEAKLKRAVAKRDRQIAASAAEIRALVGDAFNDGISGPKIAAALGVSVPRAYQIRDGRR